MSYVERPAYPTPVGMWHFVDDDCRKAGTCVCGFCKRDDQCDFADCPRVATLMLTGQGTARKACAREVKRFGFLGYKVLRKL
jgi:hypothetical protein